MMTFTDREAWLTEAANLMLDDLILPVAKTERPTFRISIGFPKHSRGGKAIAVCFAKEASSDGVNEIFINPEIDDPIRVMDACAHELIHATDNCESGHRHHFARVARGIGLEGPLTKTVAGPDLRDTLEGYAALLGEFPHRKMTMDATHRRDGTRQLKIQCNDCGAVFRTSKKWSVKVRVCPCCESTNITKS